jgi:hypothetical protein
MDEQVDQALWLTKRALRIAESQFTAEDSLVADLQGNVRQFS